MLICLLLILFALLAVFKRSSRAFKVLAVLALGLSGQVAVAQKEFDNWYFGYQAGISFTSGTARALSDGMMVSGEGSASISDAQGNLLFYTNGIYAWNRLHRRLVNGSNLGAFKDSTRTELRPNSATQGVVIVPRPGSSTEYLVFTVDAAENGLVGGLRYSVVDMARQGGLGEVTSKNNPVAVPVGDGRLTEKLLAVRHANQRDIWIMVHAWNSNVFLSYLLTPTGLAAPVLSAGGIIHQGGNNPRRDYNCIGYMKTSRDGRKLAVAQYNNSLELFDFNYGTGIVSNPRLIGQQANPLNLAGFYGVEFSPNGNLLYASSGSAITQYNLISGGQTQFFTPYYGGALQLAADGKIYIACTQPFGAADSIYMVDSPDTPGTGCGYHSSRPLWGAGRGNYLGLPNVMVRPPVPGIVLFNYGVIGTDVCAGETSSFTASVYPAIPDAVFTWDFGDPANPGNTASGPTAQHRYPRPGNYVATLTMREVSGTVRTYSQTVRILPRSSARLQSSLAGGCIGSSSLLTVIPTQPLGTTYRWQDGSTASQLRATTSGIYWVDVTPPQQCTVRDTVRLSFSANPTVALRPEYLICAEQSLVLDPGPQPVGSTYRWQDGSTAPQLSAVAPGRYAVTIVNPSGCSSTAETQVRFGDDCPYKIPNIITPNHDANNDMFVLEGLEFKGWNLQVFNRWGGLVYQQEHYDNRWDAAGQSAGVYYFLLVNATSGRQLKGWVEVVK
ncbi:gliding motility-associated C-terminal domain-containing protein [Hymenobacter negativus]|uniref:Gliding motility-associated C-terminal domain-containing protein n=1 Tax=Hymenobacter negativus TaxID=2795026 RepID=A0ABS3Q861_9BACT|nr:gliding motility-associated C-terminal domain-containing protein [Hymenobacter negativus]MBO2007430.1 gliding motility-associated C-terminal domain-containing protein [Hymenobacter negativus]